MRELVLERVARSVVGEITAFRAPANDRVHDTADQLAHPAFALRGAGLAVAIFAGDDVGRGLRPSLGDFHIVLAENCGALLIPDQGSALLPFDRVEWRKLSVGEKTVEYQPAVGPDIFGCSCFCRFALNCRLHRCHPVPPSAWFPVAGRGDPTLFPL